ncbi:MAG: peptide deformylase [Firmicutes bacterium]|nr:peptide deformylase [Bacillota bacterium]
MAVYEVVKYGQEVLRRKARPVDKVSKRITKLTKDMLETMYAADGVGLAAPQIGESLRVIVLDVGEGPLAIINPEIVEAKGRSTDVEGCLSLPGVLGYVDRAAEVTVEGLDEKGKPIRIAADGLLARALQHEIDHLDGILFIDKATGISGLDRLTEELGFKEE